MRTVYMHILIKLPCMWQRQKSGWLMETRWNDSDKIVFTHPLSGARGWGGWHRRPRPRSRRWWSSQDLRRSGRCSHWASAVPGSGPAGRSSLWRTDRPCWGSLSTQGFKGEEEMRSAEECEEDALITKGEMESLNLAAFVIGLTLTT